MGTRCSLRNARLYVVYRPSASLSATVWARVEVKFRATRQLLPFYSYHGQLPTFTILPAWFSKNPQSQRWGGLFPQNAWESALPAACRPPQTGPLIMTGLGLCLFLSTPLLHSKSKICRSRVRHKRW
jgi:hypothetical protein